jgi:hypothetical protein
LIRQEAPVRDQPGRATPREMICTLIGCLNVGKCLIQQEAPLRGQSGRAT